MAKKRLLLGTRNKGKISELLSLFADIDVEIVGLDNICEIAEPVESGSTFEENANLKAEYYAKATGYPTVADDSGLEVKILNDRPGVFSARFSGENATDEKNNAKLLRALAEKTEQDRYARFQCAMSVADKNGTIIFTSTESCQGIIASKPSGINGFGYDPIFIPNGYKESFAELPESVKNLLSHRAAAARNIARFLRSNLDMLT